MYHELTYKNMFANYAKYLAEKHRAKHRAKHQANCQHEDDILVHSWTAYSNWTLDVLHDKCQAAGFELEKFEEYDGHPPIVRCSQDEVVITPFALRACGCDDVENCYRVKLKNKDELGKFLMIVGNMFHKHGVESEKHRERGLVDPNYENYMLSAMVVENIMRELYPLVEQELYPLVVENAKAPCVIQ